MNEEILDVLIVGSGISGIGAGAHLSMKCPNKKYLINSNNYFINKVVKDLSNIERCIICTKLF